MLRAGLEEGRAGEGNRRLLGGDLELLHQEPHASFSNWSKTGFSDSALLTFGTR